MHKVIKDYVCFDLETTGFGKTAEIIEIGAIKVRDGTTVDKFSELVKPTNRISGVVTALTDFLEFIGNDILLGHNIASFDIPIVRRNVAVVMRAMFEPNYIDTMYLAKMVPGVPDHKLQTMLDYYGIVNERAHRAFEDCEATSKLFNALVDDGIAPEIRRSYSYTNIEAAQPVPVKEDIAVTMEAEELSSVAGLRIALTGNFECCSRAEVETALAQMGAKLTNSISSKTNYLIVGGLGSDRWKYNNGGGKIQQAAQLGVKILPETAISGLLKEAQNV